MDPVVVLLDGTFSTNKGKESLSLVRPERFARGFRPPHAHPSIEGGRTETHSLELGAGLCVIIGLRFRLVLAHLVSSIRRNLTGSLSQNQTPNGK